MQDNTEFFCKQGSNLQIIENLTAKVPKKKSLLKSLLAENNNHYLDGDYVFGGYEINPHKNPNEILKWKLQLIKVSKVNGSVHIGIEKPSPNHWHERQKTNICTYLDRQKISRWIEYCYRNRTKSDPDRGILIMEINLFYCTIKFTGPSTLASGFINKYKSYQLTVALKGNNTAIRILEFSKSIEHANKTKEALFLSHGAMLLNSATSVSLDNSNLRKTSNWDMTVYTIEPAAGIVYGDYLINMKEKRLQNKILRWQFEIVELNSSIMIGIDSSNRIRDENRNFWYQYSNRSIFYAIDSGGHKVTLEKVEGVCYRDSKPSAYGEPFYSGYIVTMELNTKYRELTYYLDLNRAYKIPKHFIDSNIELPQKKKCFGVAFSKIQNVEYNLFIWLCGKKKSTVQLLKFEELDLDQLNEDVCDEKKEFDNVKVNKYGKNELVAVNQHLQKQYESLSQKYRECKRALDAKSKEVTKLKYDLRALQLKYDRVQRANHLKNANFEEWNSEQVLNWVLSLKNGAFMVYHQQLKTSIFKEQIEGVDLVNLNKTDLDRMGIQNFRLKNYLLKQIQILSSSKDQCNYDEEDIIENEGAGNTKYL